MNPILSMYKGNGFEVKLFFLGFFLVFQGASQAIGQSNAGKRAGDPESEASSMDWLHWGGPNGNFTLNSSELADQWPDSGPRLVWKRELGEGYSSITASNGRLYTMYREDETEIVICLDASDGTTVWEHRYESKFSRAMRQYGPGPHSTPLIAGNTIISVGVNMMVHALNIETGEVIWQHDLVEEYAAKIPFRGYAPSPILVGDTVLIATDMPAVVEGQPEDTERANHALVAFRATDGELMWTGLEGVTAYSSPVAVKLAGREQVVLLMRKFVAAVDPNSGEELWRSPVTDAHNVATPLCHQNKVFVTAAYESGGKLLDISEVESNNKLDATEKWHSRQIRFDQGNAIWIDDYLYATTGDSGRAFFTCINTATGKETWRERGFRRATLLNADGKLIMLQEDGTLSLLRVSADGPTVLASHQIEVKRRKMWTPPTLVKSKLFVRNRTHIMVFELGKDVE